MQRVIQFPGFKNAKFPEKENTVLDPHQWFLSLQDFQRPAGLMHWLLQMRRLRDRNSSVIAQNGLCDELGPRHVSQREAGPLYHRAQMSACPIRNWGTGQSG